VSPPGDGPADATDTRTRPRRRLLALVLAGFAPWLVLVFPGQVDVLFAWGWVNTGTWHTVTLYEYLFEFTRGPRALPQHLQAWPVATALYAGALVSAFSGALFGREDRRVTAGLAVLSAVSLLRVAAGLSRPSVTALPVGVVVVLAVLWWYDGVLLRR
jgi:uncharacterized protein (TIGR04206 family)